jgi:hypothetical protein
MNVAIVIPTAYPDRLKRCLASIWKECPDFPRDKVYVVTSVFPARDNDFYGVCWIPQSEGPFNFAREVNRGIAAAGKEADVLVMNDDAHVRTPNLIKHLKDVSDEYQGMALLTPALTGQISRDGDGAWAKSFRFDPSIRRRYVQMIPFMAAFLPAALRYAVGQLDERFTKYGSDDDDYCYRARQAGCPIIVLPQLMIFHEPENAVLHRSRWGAEMFTPEGRIDRSAFIQKWNAYPPPPTMYTSPDGVSAEIVEESVPVVTVASTAPIQAPAQDPRPPITRAVHEADKIPGWMGVKELLWLAEQASQHKVIVEFGSFHGRSAKALAIATPGVLYCVDAWNWKDNGVEIWDSFRRYHAYDLAKGKVIALRMRTNDSPGWFRAHNVRPDMIFIDAGHSYPDVDQDIQNAISLMGGPGSGGLICGHDYNPKLYPDVVRAVGQYVMGAHFPVGEAGSIWAKVI